MKKQITIITDHLIMLLWEVLEKKNLLLLRKHPISHLKRICIDVENISIGVPRKYRAWWNWDAYLRTWLMLDEDPNIPIKHLPLYSVIKRIYELEGNYSLHPVNRSLKKHSALYRKIKKEGFNQNIQKHILVFIGRNGEILLRDGHHRVSILKHLGFPKQIKVTVKARHPSWSALKRDAYILHNKKLLYQPIDHPDFDDWKVHRICTDRFSSITRFVDSIEKKKVLDIGCHTGWFCHKLTRMGARVVGVDTDRTRINIAKKLSIYHGLSLNNPQLLRSRFEKYLETTNQQFDFILFLSLLQHYLRKSIARAWDAVDLISNYTNLMFLDIEEKRLPVKWAPELILEHSNFTKYTELRGDRRPLYAFLKEQ